MEFLSEKYRTFIASKYPLLVVLLLATLFAFWKLGDHPIYEWDEAHYGANGVEMMETGDYLNYHYQGVVDTWNAKPPLYTWMMVGSYQVFGTNEFAMRFPNAIAIIVFFLFFFKLVQRYKGNSFALVSSLILIGSNAIFVRHVGRSADFDGVLLATLMAMLYYFMVYHTDKKTYAIYLAGFLLFLTFMAKGFTVLMFFPGLLMFIIVSGSFKRYYNSAAFWSAFVGGFLLIAGWLMIMGIYGKEDPNSIGESTSLLTMIKHDVLDRFIGGLDGDQAHDWGFVFAVLDTHFNLWVYLLYATVLMGGYVVRKKQLSVKKMLENNPLFNLSVCLAVTSSIILTVCSTKHYWYLAPAIPFMAIILTYGIFEAKKLNKNLIIIPIAVGMFTISHQFLKLHHPEKGFRDDVKGFESSLKENEVYFVGADKTDVFLYLKWFNPAVKMIGMKDLKENDTKGALFVIRKSDVGKEEFTVQVELSNGFIIATKAGKTN